MSRPPLFHRIVAVGLTLTQVLAPLAANAAPAYVQTVKVPGLVVNSGTPLPQKNVDGSNATSSSTRVGDAVLKVAPSVLAYPDTAVGSATPIQTVTLSNLGSSSLTTGTLSASPEFSVSNNCNGVTLPPLAICQVNVTFTPTKPASQPVPGTINVPLTSGPNAGAGSILTQAAAAHWAPTSQPGFTLSTSALSFGNVNIGESATRSIRVTNSGDTSLSGSSVTFSGSSYTSSHNCPAVLSSGSSCDVTIVFTPVEGVTSSASLTVGFVGVASKAATVTATGQGDLLSANTLSQDFGPVLLLANKSLTYTISNTGALPATLAYSALPTEMARLGTCSSVLASGASCTVVLRYSPTTTAGVSGSFDVTAQNTGVSLSYSGTGVEAPAYTLTPTNSNFGNVAIGATSTKNFTVLNTGNVPLSVTSVAVTGENYSLSANACPSTLAVGMSCVVSVAYSPLTTATAAYAVKVSVLGLSDKTSTGTGTGQANPAFSTSASSLNFASVAVGSTALRSTVVQNTGNVPLSLASIAVSGSSYSANHNCGASLPVSDSCTISTTFTPTASGTSTGTLSVAYSGVAASNVALTGIGLADNLTSNTSSQGFGMVNVGSSSTMSFTVTNVGTVATPLSYSTLPASVSRSGSCSGTLGVSASCTVVLTYTPNNTTPLSGSITLTGTNTSRTLNFSGTSQLPPSFSISPAALAFGSVNVGASGTIVVTVTNTGGTNLGTVNVTTPQNVTSEKTCGTSLVTGSSCTVTLTFTPTSEGAYTDTTYIGMTTAGTKSLPTTATGVGVPQVSATASGLSGSALSVTSITNSASRVVVNVKNVGTGSLGISSTPTLTTGTRFTVAANTCTAGSSVAVNASCDITLQFLPTATGAVTDTLTLSTAAGVSNFSLTGNGVSASGIYTSCATLKAAAPGTVSGAYNIDPDGSAGTSPVINVYCEMTLDSGGWTRVMVLGDDTRYLNGKWALDGADAITAGSVSVATQEVKIGPAYQGISAFQSMLFVSTANSANWVSINSLARTQSLKTLLGPNRSTIGLGTSTSSAMVTVNNATQVRKGGTWNFGNPENGLVFNACSNDYSNNKDSENECSRLGPKFTYGYVFNWNGIGTVWDGGSEGAAYRTDYFIGETLAPSAHSPMYVYVK